MAPQLPGRWDDLIVICAATPWDGIKFQDRHLAERLSQTRPVLYVDPPFSPLTRWRKPYLIDSTGRPRLKLIAPNLAKLTILGPVGPLRPGMSVITNQLFRRGLRQACLGLEANVRAVIGSGLIIAPFGVCGEQLKIYWAQDDQVGGARMAGYSPRRVGRAERARTQEADVIVASNPSVAEAWKREGFKPVLIPFGCDNKIFAETPVAPLPKDVSLPTPIAGFVGNLVPERIDAAMLNAVADRGHSLLLVGPEHARQGLGELELLVSRPNVQWVGRKAFEELPSYLRIIDVGLVPYADTAFNRGSFPLKTLEYLAAGKAVVSTDLPATRWLGTDLVNIRSSPDTFADAVEASFATARAPDLVSQRQAFADQHSWDRRAAQFAEVLS
jgi:hypothetical protein